MAKAEAKPPTPATPAPKLAANKDAMLNLFQTEVAEENSLGKFADTLENIDVHELLKLSAGLRNQLKGIRG